MTPDDVVVWSPVYVAISLPTSVALGACVSLVGGHQSRLVLKPDGRVQTDDRVQRTPMDREQTEWI